MDAQIGAQRITHRLASGGMDSYVIIMYRLLSCSLSLHRWKMFAVKVEGNEEEIKRELFRKFTFDQRS